MKINLIKEICDNCWLTMAELSHITGIRQQRLKDISSGRVDGFKGDDVALLVENLHLDAQWLATGDGYLFKEGWSRNYPTRGSHVCDVLDRIRKIINPEAIQITYDEVLKLPDGTASKWIKKGAIPYWCIKKVSEQYDVSYDFIVYGYEDDKVRFNGSFQQSNVPVVYPTGGLNSNHAVRQVVLSEREYALLDDFRALSDKEKDAAETMLNAVAKHQVKKQA